MSGHPVTLLSRPGIGSTIGPVAFLGAVLGLLALGLAYQWSGQRRDRRFFPPPGQLVDVGGYRVHVNCSGEGGPVVLLEAGIAASSLSWAVVQPQIAAFARVCAYDRAGLAWSDAPSQPRTLDRIVDELAAVLAHVGGRGPFVLVGHSFGSFVVRTYAARHSLSVAGIVLVDPPTEWLTMTPERARLLRGGRFFSSIGRWLAHVGVVRACLALLVGGMPGAPRRFVKIFGPTAAQNLERFVLEVRKLPPDVHPVVRAIWCQPKCFRSMRDHLEAFEREGTSLARHAPPPDVAVVVISSGNQPPEELTVHRTLAESSSRGRHITARRSTHWIQFDEPEVIVAAVRELVEVARAAERQGAGRV
ncbi:MAG TPA: alpha/beta hydrolase [Vicinamibacterales bacterium]|nr:alpha/beta hydrolase [Vicinamibacterales bacterium]